MPALIVSDFDRGAELRRWALAAAIVLAGHFALIAGYWLVPRDEPEGAPESPAVLVELAPVPVSPASQQDLAPGPEMVESQPASKPLPQEKPEAAETIKKFEAPAEVTLPTPDPQPTEQKKPEENPDEQKPDTPDVPQQMAAPQTTAAPRSDQRTAAVPAAPAPGSAAQRAALMSWQGLVMARLQRNKRYPSSAKARHEQGVATLAFTVDRGGHILARKIVKSTGSAALDEEVLTMVERAAPLPAFPPAITKDTISLTVPIRFALKGP
jgi:protein TonB